MPDREFQSRAEEQLTVCFVQSDIRIYTGFLIYRTLNLSPNQSGIRAKDCSLDFSADTSDESSTLEDGKEPTPKKTKKDDDNDDLDPMDLD